MMARGLVGIAHRTSSRTCGHLNRSTIYQRRATAVALKFHQQLGYSNNLAGPGQMFIAAITLQDPIIDHSEAFFQSINRVWS